MAVLDWNVVWQIGGIGLLVAVLHTLLKSYGKEEYAYVTTVAGVVVVFSMVVRLLSQLYDTVRGVFRLY